MIVSFACSSSVFALLERLAALQLVPHGDECVGGAGGQQVKKDAAQGERVNVASINYGFIIYTQVRMTKLLVMLSVAVRSTCSRGA